MQGRHGAGIQGAATRQAGRHPGQWRQASSPKEPSPSLPCSSTPAKSTRQRCTAVCVKDWLLPRLMDDAPVLRVMPVAAWPALPPGVAVAGPLGEPRVPRVLLLEPPLPCALELPAPTAGRPAAPPPAPTAGWSAAPPPTPFASSRSRCWSRRLRRRAYTTPPAMPAMRAVAPTATDAAIAAVGVPELLAVDAGQNATGMRGRMARKAVALMGEMHCSQAGQPWKVKLAVVALVPAEPGCQRAIVGA